MPGETGNCTKSSLDLDLAKFCLPLNDVGVGTERYFSTKILHAAHFGKQKSPMYVKAHTATDNFFDLARGTFIFGG